MLEGEAFAPIPLKKEGAGPFLNFYDAGVHAHRHAGVVIAAYLPAGEGLLLNGSQRKRPSNQAASSSPHHRQVRQLEAALEGGCAIRRRRGSFASRHGQTLGSMTKPRLAILLVLSMKSSSPAAEPDSILSLPEPAPSAHAWQRAPPRHYGSRSPRECANGETAPSPAHLARGRS